MTIWCLTCTNARTNLASVRVVLKRPIAGGDASHLLQPRHRRVTLYSHLFPTTPCTMAETRLAFKAGRAFRRDNTNFVDPDPTKGAILIQNGEDTLLHFIWKNRSNSEVEEVRFCSTVLSILGCAHVRVTLVAYAK